ncbi:MAG: alpha/beta hydrolase [Victivallaceae bacterium]
MNKKINTINLWPHHVSAQTGNPEDDFQPYLTPYLLNDGEMHGVVLICPGGAYGWRAAHEGGAIAEKLNELGIHALVVEYRVAPYRYPAPQQDIFRAVKITRGNAQSWYINPEKIAVMGFSAGGHLCASSGVLFDKIDANCGDAYDKENQRPDVIIPCYAVISSGEFGHQGSFDNLLGGEETATRKFLSLENLVTADTPPAFLWHTAEDGAVPVENSLMFCSALRRNQVPFELHIFPRGHHGLGLAKDFAEVAIWPELCVKFLKNLGF